MKIFTDNIDPSVLSELYNIDKKNIYNHIRVMPDVHEGNSIVGFTAYIKDKLSPNIIGPDIGCGMLYINLGKADINLELFDHRLRKLIPSGSDLVDKKDKYYQKENINFRKLNCYKDLIRIPELERSMGTLGGGNHFIELDKDEENNIYLIIHTGSRNLGKQVWSIYDKRGNYLSGDELNNYLEDCNFCNSWAKSNRMIIARKLLDSMHINNNLKDVFDCPHNFIEGNLIRKGAIKATGKVIIPMNMRDGCILGEGLSNEDWNYSGPHGAGRLLSRNQAKKQITIEEYKKSMEGIYSTSVTQNTIDESPMAYKPIEKIIAKIGDTIKIDKIIKPIYNYKNSKK